MRPHNMRNLHSPAAEEPYPSGFRIEQRKAAE
jgi:hypothetical protein